MHRFVFPSIIFITTFLLLASTVSVAQTNQSGEKTESNQQASKEKGELRWVSDDLFTYLRAGPGKGYRLLGSVTAGSKIELLKVDRDAGYAEIIDERQRTGWIEIRYVSRKTSIRDNIIDLEASLIEKELSVQKMQAKMQNAMQQRDKSNDQENKLNKQITQQFEEISRLHKQLEKREININIRWFTRGSVLAVSALLIGYILGIFGRRRRTNNQLM